ncbi:MAG TPA: NAD(P)-dependent oxidoreductase, partial [Gemmatimonadota bacterium]|nr:NAD(P)-dependent oxidoreductase [Gemmatimonadota bacterium]
MRPTTALQTFRVLVSDPLSDAGLGRLKAAPDADVTAPGRLERAALLDAIAGHDALIVRSETRVDEELLSRAPSLRVIGRAGAGLDNIDVEAATHRGVLVMNTPGANAVATAEHTWALLLALARRLPAATRSLESGEWERSRFTGVQMAGKTIGIVGLGRVGREVARRAQGFGMRVLGCDPYLAADQAEELRVELADLDRLLDESDVVSLHAALTMET